VLAAQVLGYPVRPHVLADNKQAVALALRWARGGLRGCWEGHAGCGLQRQALALGGTQVP
jgi:hypothetical protein